MEYIVMDKYYILQVIKMKKATELQGVSKLLTGTVYQKLLQSKHLRVATLNGHRDVILAFEPRVVGLTNNLK